MCRPILTATSAINHGKRRHSAAPGEFGAPFLNGAQRSVNRKVQGSNPWSGANCPLSGHSSRLWQDIVRRPTSSEWLVVAGGVEGQSTEELAVVGDNADVGSSDEELDLAVFMRGADRDVAQPAEVAQSHMAEGVDFVAANAVVGSRGLLGWSGLDERDENGEWGPAIQCAVGPAAVVVVAKGVELKLQLGKRARWSLLAEKALEGLVKALDLAAGLWMVGRGVFEDDAEALQLELQKNLAASRLGGEDGSVVAKQGGRKAELN